MRRNLNGWLRSAPGKRKPPIGFAFVVSHWCTAMAPDAMQPLLAWLDRSRKPVFVQLPQAHYARLRGAWDLPDISVTEAAR